MLACLDMDNREKKSEMQGRMVGEIGEGRGEIGTEESWKMTDSYIQSEPRNAGSRFKVCGWEKTCRSLTGRCQEAHPACPKCI